MKYNIITFGGKEMLIDEIVDFCDKDYSSQDTKNVCKDCKHLECCSGSCKHCLEEVHYPNKYPKGMKNYECPNIINFYVCDYSYKYASEIWYLLNNTDTLKKLDKFNIMSIGCGGCPDLMAFESFIRKESIEKPISYLGIDVNKLWEPIHKRVCEYCEKQSDMSITFEYADAIQLFNDYYFEDINIIILQYVISHFYNTDQINEIESFFDNLVENIIAHKSEESPFIIIINDVNSCNRGRDNFDILIEKLRSKNYHGICPKYYFDYNIQNEHQRYGTKHNDVDVLYNVPNKLNKYQPWKYCSSAQLLIEVK